MDVVAFFALACGLTWALDLPLALALHHQVPPAPYAVACAGLSAFGPAIAALVVLVARGELGRGAGRWRFPVRWVCLALVTPWALNLVATLIESLLGGHPRPWFHPPENADMVAATLVFPIGEELGWRGFAQPRLAARIGPIRAALGIGVVWTAWHAGMMVSPTDGTYQWSQLGWSLLYLVPMSVVFAWFAARTGASLWVAIALHAGAHLDNFTHVPESELRLRVLWIAVGWVAAALAARSLAAGAVVAPER